VISYQNCMRCHILIYHEFTCCPCIGRMKIVLHENPLASRADTFYVWNYRTLQTQLPSLDLMTQASTSDLSDTDRKIASMSRSFPAPAINPTYGTRPMQFSKDAQYPRHTPFSIVVFVYSSKTVIMKCHHRNPQVPPWLCALWPHHLSCARSNGRHHTGLP
jgi:hypothetical protein